MLDKDRVLTKLAELDTYLDELRQIMPASFEDYKRIEKRRGCERLLQLSIECVVDICKLLVSQLRLGLPSEENDVFKKLERGKIVSRRMAGTLRKMRGFRNILIHEYADIDDELVYEYLRKRLGDFESFRKNILASL